MRLNLNKFGKTRQIALFSSMAKTRISGKDKASPFRRITVVRSVPDAMTLFGIAGNGKPRNPHEMDKAHRAIADDANKAQIK